MSTDKYPHTTMTIRLPAELKQEFTDWCTERQVPQSLIIRGMMEAVVDGRLEVGIVVRLLGNDLTKPKD